MTHNVRSDSNHQFFSDKRVDDQVINPLRFVPLTAETKTLVLQKLRQRIKCDGNLVFDEDFCEDIKRPPVGHIAYFVAAGISIVSLCAC